LQHGLRASLSGGKPHAILLKTTTHKPAKAAGLHHSASVKPAPRAVLPISNNTAPRGYLPHVYPLSIGPVVSPSTIKATLQGNTIASRFKGKSLLAGKKRYHAN